MSEKRVIRNLNPGLLAVAIAVAASTVFVLSVVWLAAHPLGG